MDRTAIGKIALGHVTSVFASTNIANPKPHGDDTNMSWDGCLEIYKGEPFGKKTFAGNIPIQIKGHLVDRFDDKCTILLDDLKVYRTEKRILYLVCKILKNDISKYKIYYKPFQLFDLEKTIEDIIKHSKHEKTLHFSELPIHDTEAIKRILKAFMLDSEQSLIAGVLSFEDLKRKNLQGDLKFGVYNLPSGSTIKDFIKNFEQQKPYIYLHDTRYHADYVIDRFGEGKLFIEEPRQVEIRIDDQILYKEIRLVHSSQEGVIIYKLGECITITLMPDRMEYEYSMRGNLSERLRATKLLNALYEGKPVYVNNAERHFALNAGKQQKEAIKNDLKIYSLIEQCLEKINVKKDLECDGLSPDDWKNLIVFSRSVVLGEECALQFKDSPLGFLKVANISIFGCSKPTQNGLFRLYDFFDKNKPLTWYYNKEEKPSSQFLILGYFDDIELSDVDNLSYSILSEELSQIQINDGEEWILTNLILRLLNYYDTSKRKDVLEAAVSLSGHMCDIQSNEINSLNYLQAVKRVRSLQDNEIADLVEMRNNSNNLQIKCGCCILLEETSEFNLYFSKLSDEEKAVFSKYPIYHCK